jgi:Tol biopolymer transport system component
MTEQTRAGTRIGPYEILGWLGSGGMGEVYRARDHRLGRDVALKLITGLLAGDAARIRRFEQEARAAGQLNHPNVLAVYDIGVHDGAPYIVSELLEGRSLRSRLADGAVSWRKVLDYAKQVAEGLAAAHDRGIVHRDVKPDNLFITVEGRIKILDFGIAKLTSSEDVSGRQTGMPTDTAAGTVIGTAAYMSPEQVRGEAVDARSDIFSLGSVLYEMLAARPAFQRETAAETMTAILKEDPPPLPSIADAPALARIVDRCLEKSRESRFQSARDLAFGLDVLSGTQRTAVAPAALGRRWPAAAGIAIVVLSVAAALASWLTRTTATPLDRLLTDARFSPFTDFEGSELDATISPDGKVVAFIADRDGPFHVWVKQVGTGSFFDRTPGMPDQRNTGPNRSVGFTGEGGEIWVNGSTNRRLTLWPLMGGGAPRVFLRDHAVNVGYSPDGARLVYFTYDGDPLVVADASGANEHELIPAHEGDHNHFPAFSTDGRWIYYAHAIQTMAEFDVWRIPAAGGAPEQLTTIHRDVQYVTPLDAHIVLFVATDADRSGPWLWALDVDRKITRRVSVGLERYLSVAASADGKHLVATVSKSTAGLWSLPILDRLVEERDVTPFKVPSARALSPRFGSGSTLFYMSSSGGGDGLWRVKDGRAEDFRLGSDGPLVEAPAVSPAGDRVAVVLGMHGKERLATVSADGADRKLLSDAVDIRGTVSWSPDGKSIVAGGSDAGGTGLFVFPAEGGQPVRLTTGPAADPVWSPDGPFGQVIAYVGLQSAFAPLLAVRPDKTPVPLPLIRILTGGRGRYRFLPDGRLVYLLGESGVQDFWLLNLATKDRRRLTQLSNLALINAFDIAPDGSRIVFDRVRENADVMWIDLAK